MEDIEKWRLSGKIAAQVLAYGKELIKTEESVIDITQAVEKKIEELGAKPAFPPQISLNAAAAHECADPSDNRTLNDELVKLDLGVHLDGCMSDNAVTIDLSGKYSDLIEATQEALDLAIKAIKPGITNGEIGAIIGQTISLRGYEPVRNLSGHGLGRYQVHARPSIPNFDSGEQEVLRPGMVIAIEPFATPGDGLISEKGTPRVFMRRSSHNVRDPISREILSFIDSYRGVPFSRRWLLVKFPQVKVDFALRNLVAQEVLESYPPLVEVSGKPVAQAERTVLITKDGVEILTKI